MVDIGASGSPLRMQRGALPAHHAAEGMTVEVRPADDMALADYETLCRNSLHAPAQHPLWIRSWVMATGADVIVVTLSRRGQPACALALEVVQEGPFRVARFPGGSHANGNFVAISRGSVEPLSPEEGQALVDEIRRARPDIDLVLLQRQNPTHEGVQNPLSNFATIRSPNVSLAVDLSGGFEQMLGRRSGKRKRKKYRLQVRKFEEAGGYRLLLAGTTEEADRLIGAFFEMKAARLSGKGIANVFGSGEVQTFFRLLFQGALDYPEPPFILHGVEVAGTLRAVNGCSVTQESVVCEFGGISEGLANASPGYFLDYHSIEHASQEGKAIYDFSVGDEDYKRSWCDLETWQFETLLPLTAKGRVAWACEMARAQAVRFVKSNEPLWSLLKQLRTRVAGSPKPPAAED